MVFEPLDLLDAEERAKSGDDGMDLVITGAVMVMFAIVALALSFYNKRLPRPSAADLDPLIASRPLPFSVCTRCRIMIDLPRAVRCPQCDSSEHCVRVEQESERSIASAAMDPPPR